jgi:uncharacterized protein (TIGR00251 family)
MEEIKTQVSRYIRIKVTPRCKTEGVISTLEDGTIKIGVHAVAEKGKANLSVLKVLAMHLQIKESELKIISGHTSQIKLIKINESS